MKSKHLGFQVYLAIEEISARYNAVIQPLIKLADIAPLKEIRDAVKNVSDSSVNFTGTQLGREDLKAVKDKAKATLKSSGEFEHLKDEEKRLVTKVISGDMESDKLSGEMEEKYQKLNDELLVKVNEYLVCPFPHQNPCGLN